ncbi:MAG TPA: dihydrolipoyl dehydrogenase [Blastocatellia bacterium]|nr:dihydrolipoyl dehydrogenase [Blastocatellia bacterium]HMV86701.1 dihydrolipoyl dehydrogenase [Blastocatellia bacterium]HMX25976.1 dihydrolipoyl dehydrogenase [Blastocatellia bacterium]HMZ17711.1 dihydrolipoyl dehydrogenase [Blastocatellia bacterium]
MAKEYDVVVLGAGPGGYVAAIRASQLGLKTAIIEKQYWGGVCLNVGCIPSKALLRNAELAHILNHEAKTFGINIEGKVTFDYGEAFRRSRKVADGRVKGVHFLMKKNKIDEFDGWATFTDANTFNVALNKGGNETVKFKHCIIAAGATTRLIPGSKLSERVVTYEEQIMEDKLPKSIIIAGAGAIGVEFAYVMNNYGVDVTIVEFLDRVVPLEDEDVSKELAKQYSKAGVKLLTSTRVEKIEDTGANVRVTVSDKDGKQQTLEADKVMQAIGFKPRTEGYGLENTGVKLTDRGAIDINEKMQTNVPHIYAIGDVTAKLMLAHVAEAMGVIAAENIKGEHTITLEFDMMPRATYCQPQIASFGYTEKQARERGYEVNVAKFPFTANGKAHGLGDATGFVKLISDKKYGEMLGAHMIGPDVTELLPELTLARYAELTPEEIARNVHAHPTLSEAIKEAAHGLGGHMINF